MAGPVTRPTDCNYDYDNDNDNDNDNFRTY